MLIDTKDMCQNENNEYGEIYFNLLNDKFIEFQNKLIEIKKKLYSDIPYPENYPLLHIIEPFYFKYNDINIYIITNTNIIDEQLPKEVYNNADILFIVLDQPYSDIYNIILPPQLKKLIYLDRKIIRLENKILDILKTENGAEKYNPLKQHIIIGDQCFKFEEYFDDPEKFKYFYLVSGTYPITYINENNLYILSNKIKSFLKIPFGCEVYYRSFRLV